MTPFSITSGGQTGADRASLDWAISHNIPHGGYCPKGRLAEDGPIPAHYNLRETSTANYPERTEANVRTTDGTVIFTLSSRLHGGCKLTASCAVKHKKPHLHLHSGSESPAKQLANFIQRRHIARLNVAGSRLSSEPEIGTFVTAVLESAYQLLRQRS